MIVLPANWTAPGFLNDRFQVETGDGHNLNVLRAEPYRDLNGDLYLIPEGQPSDGGSEPPVLWGPPWNLAPFGKEWREYVLHDSAYQNTLLKWNGAGWVKANLSKQQSDSLLYNAMVICGVSYIRRTAIINGLKAFGGSAFSNDRKEQTA